MKSRRWIIVPGIIALVMIPLPQALSWSNHTEIAAISLSGEVWSARQVNAESLDDFLAACKDSLPAVLDEVEAKAANDFPGFRPRPSAIAFNPHTAGAALRESFLAAIRVNPEMPYLLFLKVPVGGDRRGRPDLPWQKALLSERVLPNAPFAALAPGKAATALEVVQTACDEPDYGMDYYLYEDNGSAWGAVYGFGTQPFGNPKLSYGTQSPFHLSFDNEPALIHALAKFTTRSNLGYRIDLFTALARFAFANGHEYWGWRFAGWALHYVQDLTMPYHASLMPSKTTFQLLLLNTFGSKADRDGTITLLSNRHAMFENYQYFLLTFREGNAAANPANPAIAALLPSREPAESAAASTTASARTIDISAKTWAIKSLGAASRARSFKVDNVIAKVFPAKYVNDPAYDFGAWMEEIDYTWNPREDLAAMDPASAAAFDLVLAESLKAAGDAGRTFTGALAAGLR